MRSVVLAAIITASSLSTLTNAQEPMNLDKGVYRLDGQCTLLNNGWADITEKCEDYLGIHVQQSGLPWFFFMETTGGGHIFRASALKSNTDNISVYVISSVVTTAIGMSTPSNGTCTLNTKPASLSVVCDTTSGKFFSKKPGAKGRFQGNGTWQFTQQQDPGNDG